MKMRTYAVAGALIALSMAACSDAPSEDSGSTDQLESSIRWSDGDTILQVILNRELREGETLHARVRSLAEGENLNCGADAAAIPSFNGSDGAGAYDGPAVNAQMFQPIISPETLLAQTEDMYLQRLATTFFADICVMSGNGVVHQARYDLAQAQDRLGSTGKFDSFDDGVKIESNQAYAEACIAEMGEIPFWTKIGEGEEPDYNTVDCTEIGTPIPSEIDGVPQTEKLTRKCDQPQYIYNHCEQDARVAENGPRVASARNEQGTHWVLLCRKSHTAHGRYEDMAMIGHNPFTGHTCFFQNQLPFGEEPKPANNGMRIPHPADNVSSEASPEMWNSLWMGIQGGMGPEAGINCMGCHSTDPFIHSPWIDGAKRDDGTPVVPKMGQHPDFVEGYNGPVSLIDAEDQGWYAPKHLVSEEAAACTRCHRMAIDQWTAPSSRNARTQANAETGGGCVFCGQAPWLDRLEQEQASWEALVTDSHKTFAEAFWMPPNAKDVLNEDLWAESEYKKAMDFIRACAADPAMEGCIWEDLPEEPGDPTELPFIEDTGPELAKKALKILGVRHTDGVDGPEVEATRRCAECHPTSRVALRDWRNLTNDAIRAGIDLESDPETLEPARALEIVNYMRKNGEGSVFAAAKVGMLAPGVQFPWFQKLFRKAYPDTWGIHYGAFLQRVSMPKGAHPPMSAEEFAIVRKWFVTENLAHLDELVKEVPPPANCDEARARILEDARQRTGVAQDFVPPAFINHLDKMEFEGWGAVNEENGINMYGCTSADPLQCFADAPQMSLLPQGDVKHKIIEIKDLGFDTSFWMRSSADGRFVGNGGRGSEDGGFGATITDLITGQNIGVKGSYDPGFFPNNDGFIMQGGGAGLCGQSVLTDPDAIMGGIDFTETGCSRAEGINLYQHVAVSLDGGDYFIINSQFTSDSGSSNTDPRASFGEGATMKFSPLVFTGSSWDQKPAVIVDSPFEGDAVLSPSGEMVISRVAGPDGVAVGYSLRRVIATPNSEGSYNISIDQPFQFICAPGAKANISFDERFMVTHTYENETANIYVYDMVTGTETKVTEMTGPEKALFPHFRSDGWIYFLITGGERGDRAVATDVVLHLTKGL